MPRQKSTLSPFKTGLGAAAPARYSSPQVIRLVFKSEATPSRAYAEVQATGRKPVLRKRASVNSAEARTADAWVRMHLGEIAKYAGKWVVVGPEGIAGSGNSLAEVKLDALTVGGQKRLAFKVPAQSRKKVVSVRRG